MEPSTDGNGGIVDKCVKCGSRTGTPRVMTASLADTGKPCKVEGCPGRLDSGGVCACCQRRAAWMVANSPKRDCEICGGAFIGRANAKHCAACKKVAAKVASASATPQPRLKSA